MRIFSELCHIDETRAIVKATCWEGDINLGSSLGEARSAHEAEDNAIQRLLSRVKTISKVTNKKLDSTIDTSNDISKLESQTSSFSKINDAYNYQERTNSPKSNNSDSNKTNISSTSPPDDWSKELTQIDIEIKRLNWNRILENKYLTQNFSVSDRSRITDYKILCDYLESLKNITIDKDQALDTDTKDNLINKSNELINQLLWDTNTARRFLNKTMNVSSRQELEISQLNEFVMLLQREVSKSDH